MEVKEVPSEEVTFLQDLRWWESLSGQGIQTSEVPQQEAGTRGLPVTGGWGRNAGVSVQTEAGVSLCLVGHGEQLRLYSQCPATQLDARFKKMTWAAMWLWAEGAGQE